LDSHGGVFYKRAQVSERKVAEYAAARTLNNGITGGANARGKSIAEVLKSGNDFLLGGIGSEVGLEGLNDCRPTN